MRPIVNVFFGRFKNEKPWPKSTPRRPDLILGAGAPWFVHFNGECVLQ